MLCKQRIPPQLYIAILWLKITPFQISNTLNIKVLELYCNIRKWNIELDTLVINLIGDANVFISYGKRFHPLHLIIRVYSLLYPKWDCSWFTLTTCSQKIHWPARAVSAKTLFVLLLSTLLRLQRDHHLHEITQGVATLYPGLCAFALTARQLPIWTSELGYSIFLHQTVHPNYQVNFKKISIKSRLSQQLYLQGDLLHIRK